MGHDPNHEPPVGNQTPQPPVGAIHTVADVGQLDTGRTSLYPNAPLEHQSDPNQTICNVPQMIAHLSQYYALAGLLAWAPCRKPMR